MPSTLENAASKTMGAMKDVKGTLKGLNGVFRHLMEEHGKVGVLLTRVKSSTDEDVRSKLWPTIRHELLAHERGEAAVVYPALAEYPETAQIAAAHTREAGELETAVRAVHELAFNSPSWKPAFDRLVELVEQHVSQEESDYFPKGQKVVGSERSKSLLTEFEIAKGG